MSKVFILTRAEVVGVVVTCLALGFALGRHL